MEGMNRRGGDRGSIAPVFLVVVSMMVVLGWILVGSATAHYLQAAHHTREIAAGQLARAGVEEAVARIDEGTVPPEHLEGTEATGRYEVTITPTGVGTYTVESKGTVENRSRVITAEVAPPPEPFVALAGGDVTISQSNGVSLGGQLSLEGDINAAGNVDLSLMNAALSLGGGLRVDGDVRAGRNVRLSAANYLLSEGSVRITGGVAANGDITFNTVSGLGYSQIAVDGPVSYMGDLEYEGWGLGDADLSGPVNPGEGVTVPPYRNADVAYYEALVADLEEQGEMRHLSPDEACGTITVPTRVTGDLDCGIFEPVSVEDGAILVVDGSLDAHKAQVQGLLYVRGGEHPSPAGDVQIDTVLLLEVIGSVYPMAGGGTIAATGNIGVGEGQLATLLSFSSESGTVLQVLALSTGSADTHNDIDFVMGGAIEGLGGRGAAPLFFYAADAGDIRITNGEGVGLINFEAVPLIIVAGGDITVTSIGVANAVGDFSIEARPEVWQQVPPFLQGLGRARVLTWEWTDS